MQFEIFTEKISDETSRQILHEKIASWMKENKIQEIISVSQSESFNGQSRYLTVIIFAK
ncbi:MAG: hypothetical protein HY813_02580 [Candidatus Portnoybacteria bacterium]|nr:hypothetical protein [Candidatus Portnoybacteria bacterium]